MSADNEELAKSTSNQEAIVYDDESFYPRPAEESESESFQTDEEVGTSKDKDETTPKKMESPSELTKPSPLNFDENDEKDSLVGNKMDAMTCGVCFQILLDPISLGCGHSFCELCLAGMWNANRQPVPLCPMCREAWGRVGDRLPSVNVQLRDIIEQQNPIKLKERRDSISEDEKELLKKFSQARIIGTRPRLPSTGNGNRRIGINIPINRTFICMLISVFIIAMLLAMALVSGTIWLLDIHDGYMIKPVKEWNNQDVLQWMKGLGESVRKECTEVFEKERIDGPHLLSLTDESLLDNLGISNQYTRQSLLLSIRELSEKEAPEPRNFKEFRVVNREELMLVTFLYNFHPRLTFLYLYIFKYKSMFLPLVRSQLNIRSNLQEQEEMMKEQKDQEELAKVVRNELWTDYGDIGDEGEMESEGEDMRPEKPSAKPDLPAPESIEPSTRQLIALAIEALLVPHVVVMSFVYTHFSKDSVLFFALMFHCGMSTFVELKLLRNRLRNPRGREQYSLSQIVRTFRYNVLGYFVTFCIGSVLYFILPILLLDLIFYGMLFRSVLSIMFNYILKPCLGRTIRFVAAQANQRLMAQRGVV